MMFLIQTINLDRNCLGLATGHLVHDLSSDLFQNYIER
ncbi:hypothetical protein ACCUM_2931 [Candidatus Accumulibacter phosphatis]|uniref:Uncharacterized protein n=1 Tax=Candidatus Accumulibacter phosphatis TaxID=327160 RepID=A0A5S4EQF4_9PROT|nr:hypothetical protein ACCUM_2931 [Candidatus Accumulibacter phosphatis]